MAAWMVNVLVVSGGWLPARWPGVLIAMAVLTVTAVVCAPGIIWRTEDGAQPVGGQRPLSTLVFAETVIRRAVG